MVVTVHTDPLGALTVLVEHPNERPNYADGSAQAIRAAAVQALANTVNVSFAELRKHVSLAATDGPHRTVYALSTNDSYTKARAAAVAHIESTGDC